MLRGLWRFYCTRAELHTAWELAEQLLTLAQRLQEPALLLEAHHALGLPLFYFGELARARVHLEQSTALYDPQQHRSHAFRYGYDPAVACQIYGAWTLWLLGYPDQALQRIHDALTLAQELAHPFSLAYALHFAAMLHAFRREGQATQERAEATLTLSTEQGFPLWIAGGTILWGWARAVQGQGEEGLTTIQQGLDALIMTGARLLRPYFLAALTEVYGRSEQATQGLSVVSEALTILEESGERWWEAELHRLKGELLLAQAGKERPFVEEAETCLYQAIEIARRQQAKSLELRAAMSLVVRFVSSL